MNVLVYCIHGATGCFIKLFHVFKIVFNCHMELAKLVKLVCENSILMARFMCISEWLWLTGFQFSEKGFIQFAMQHLMCNRTHIGACCKFSTTNYGINIDSNQENNEPYEIVQNVSYSPTVTTLHLN